MIVAFLFIILAPVGYAVIREMMAGKKEVKTAVPQAVQAPK